MDEKIRQRRLAAVSRRMEQKMEQVADALDIPKEFLAGTGTIHIVGNSEITIEGQLSILEYSQEMIRLNTKEYIINITGTDFEVKDLGAEYIRITGKFRGVEYM